MAAKVKVAVRVRPFNERELSDASVHAVVQANGPQLTLFHISGYKSARQKKDDEKTFTFDHCFWSVDPSDAAFAGQERVYEDVGLSLVSGAFEGYNGCLFAYGQTGSGKSYTMMGGSADARGVIPRLCEDLFAETSKRATDGTRCAVEATYIEIYNETVRDLLNPGGKERLKVREHATLGPYVEGLSVAAVGTWADMQAVLSEGNRVRTVGATNMNAESSRSHAVFTITLSQSTVDDQTQLKCETVSRLSLVDLAGSERANRTGATGDRLREAGSINKSLTTLGLVISALADGASAPPGAKRPFVPYRDSVLTWLLKECLGGNARTAMIATISPSSDSYEETLSTLRYADRAKRIVNRPVVNEDPNARIVRELREEVARLKGLLEQGGAQPRPVDDAADRAVAEGLRRTAEAAAAEAERLRLELSERERLVESLSRTWEEKLRITENVHLARQRALADVASALSGDAPCLLGVCNGHFVAIRVTARPRIVGSAPPEDDYCDATEISADGVLPSHFCVQSAGDCVMLTPFSGAQMSVNGVPAAEDLPVTLEHGDVVTISDQCELRLNVSDKQARGASEPPATPAPPPPVEAHPQVDIDKALAMQRIAYEQRIAELEREAAANAQLQWQRSERGRRSSDETSATRESTSVEGSTSRDGSTLERRGSDRSSRRSSRRSSGASYQSTTPQSTTASTPPSYESTTSPSNASTTPQSSTSSTPPSPTSLSANRELVAMNSPLSAPPLEAVQTVQAIADHPKDVHAAIAEDDKGARAVPTLNLACDSESSPVPSLPVAGADQATSTVPAVELAGSAPSASPVAETVPLADTAGAAPADDSVARAHVESSLSEAAGLVAELNRLGTTHRAHSSRAPALSPVRDYVVRKRECSRGCFSVRAGECGARSVC